jgi:thiol:disulfide interchange protein
LIGALLLALLVFLLQLSLQAVWWAGHSFGPRYWTDVTPLFAIVLAWALEWSWQRSRPVFGLLLLTGLAAVGVQAIGAFCYPSTWGKQPVDIDVAHERLWDWRDSDLTRCLRECPKRWPPKPGFAPALPPPGS